METQNKNGKWQLVFWLVSGLFVMVSVYLGNSVIANDRLNTAEHKEIRQVIYDKLSSIDTRIARIEVLVNRDGK